jgi:hypothetical protein
MHGYGYGLKQKTIDVHLLGRTARAGQSGQGRLILDLVEKRFVSQLTKTTTITEVSSASLVDPEHCQCMCALDKPLLNYVTFQMLFAFVFIEYRFPRLEHTCKPDTVACQHTVSFQLSLTFLGTAL